MTVVSQYAYLHARVSVLTQYLFQEKLLSTLIDGGNGGNILLQHAGVIRHSLEETFPRMEGKEYAAILEQHLIGLFLADVKNLVGHLDGVARDLLIYWARRYELANLKMIIRGRIAGQNSAWIHKELIDVGTFATFRVGDLLQTEDVSEMLRRLEATAYKNIARQARTLLAGRNEPFTLDAVIDKHYHAELHQCIRALPIFDQRYLRPLIGILIDRFNLVWLLRYRFSHDLPPAHAYYLLIPGGIHLTSDRLLSLIRLGTFGEVIRQLPTALAAVVGTVATTSEVEDRLTHEIERQAQIVLKRTLFSVARAFAYLLIREYQLYQIHAILKGKALGLDESVIRRAARC
ncbi:V/A-type H+/Na+-transporting ATPase subunit C [Gammaproteobacteria bacterium]